MQCHFFLQTKIKIENLTFVSVKSLEGQEYENFVNFANQIVENSKLNPFNNKDKKVLFCFYNNKLFYSIVALGKSIGNTMTFGNYSIINFSETNFLNGKITGMSKENNTRNIVDSANHELTHVYISTGLSLLDYFLIKKWKNEGIAECIATSSSYNIQKGIDLFIKGKNDKSNQYKYFKYRLAVLYLTKEKKLSYEEILQDKNLNYKEILKEIKKYDKEFIENLFK